MIQQQTDYPDPEQLKTWAREMVPFTELGDSTLDEDEYIVVTSEEDILQIEYHYRPTYIMVEVAPDEWKRLSDVSGHDISHEDVYEEALVSEEGEDFFCLTTHGSDEDGNDARYDAYWVLEETRIKRTEA